MELAHSPDLSAVIRRQNDWPNLVHLLLRQVGVVLGCCWGAARPASHVQWQVVIVMLQHCSQIHFHRNPQSDSLRVLSCNP
jgi:hypothetical protein